MIEDVVTQEEIERFCNENNISKGIGKPLMAKLMSNAVEMSNYQIGQQCKDNFEILFRRILSYFNE